MAPRLAEVTVQRYLTGMTIHTKVSAKGQIVIPKGVRDRLAWKPGTALEVIEGAGAVTLRPKVTKKDADFDKAIDRLQKIAGGPYPYASEADWDVAIDKMFRENPSD